MRLQSVARRNTNWMLLIRRVPDLQWLTDLLAGRLCCHFEALRASRKRTSSDGRPVRPKLLQPHMTLLTALAKERRLHAHYHTRSRTAYRIRLSIDKSIIRNNDNESNNSTIIIAERRELQRSWRRKHRCQEITKRLIDYTFHLYDWCTRGRSDHIGDHWTAEPLRGEVGAVATKETRAWSTHDTAHPEGCWFLCRSVAHTSHRGTLMAYTVIHVTEENTGSTREGRTASERHPKR